MVDSTDDLIARLRLKGPQAHEQPNHHVRRMEIERIAAADALTAAKERIEVLEGALSRTVRADNLREVYHSLPNGRNRIGDKRSRKSRARDAWLRAFRKAAKEARAALDATGKGEG